VDGTLLLTHDEVYVAANRLALEEVFGTAPEGPDVPGDPAPAHPSRGLRTAGVEAAELEARLPQ